MDKFIVKSDERERAYVIHCSLTPEYKSFYNWLYTVKLEYSYDDFPRDYIVLSEADENVMLTMFEANIFKSEPQT